MWYDFNSKPRKSVFYLSYDINRQKLIFLKSVCEMGLIKDEEQVLVKIIKFLSIFCGNF